MPIGVYERTEKHRAQTRIHGACVGERKTPEYRAWRHMNIRCNNPNSPDFSLYGGRGIKVCDQWRHDFARFLADMGPRPSARYSIDRIDSNGNYEPGNCRWATTTEQVRGRRNARTLTVNGETLPLIEWAHRLGIEYHALHARLRRMPLERAIRIPYRGVRPNEVDQ